MKGVRPLKPEELTKAFQSLNGRKMWRNRALFLLQYYTGRRISQTLALRIRDVVNSKGMVVESIWYERKTVKGKIEGQVVKLHKVARRALRRWVHVLQRDGYMRKDHFLFQSSGKLNQPITRFRALRIYKKAFHKAGLEGRLGTHSLRKAYAAFMHTHFKGDLFKIQKALGHKDPKSTADYLSFKQEELNEAIDKIRDVRV